MKIILSIFFLLVSIICKGQDIPYVASKDTTRQLFFTRSLPLDTNQYSFDQYDYFDWKILKPAVGKNTYNISVYMYFLIDSSGNVIKNTLEVFRISGTDIVNNDYEQKIIEETKKVFANLPRLTYLLRETDPSKTKYISMINYRKCR